MIFSTNSYYVLVQDLAKWDSARWVSAKWEDTTFWHPAIFLWLSDIPILMTYLKREVWNHWSGSKDRLVALKPAYSEN